MAKQPSRADATPFHNEVEFHHDPDHSPCEACMAMNVSWQSRIIDEVVVCNSKIQIG